MDAGRHLLAELVEVGLHGAGGDDRQDEAERWIALGTGGTEQVDGPIRSDLGRWSLTPVGQVPRWRHFQQLRPVWPILASSCSQTLVCPASGWAALVSAIRPRNYF